MALIVISKYTGGKGAAIKTDIILVKLAKLEGWLKKSTTGFVYMRRKMQTLQNKQKLFTSESYPQYAI